MDEFGDEIIPGDDWPTFYTPVPVWLLLSGCSAQAYRMYVFLAEHINNRRPGQRIACPKQTAIARALDLKDDRKVARYRKELAALGAIEVEEYRYAGGMRRGYRYKVRFNPPAGYSGYLALSDFYEANPDVRSASQEGRTVASKTAVSVPPEGKTAGQPGGVKKDTTGGGENATSRGGENDTLRGGQHAAPELDQLNTDPMNDAAPPSSAPVGAPDVAERPDVGSRDAARERAEGGNAAPRKSKKGTFGNLPGPRVDLGPIREAVAPDLAALLPQPWPRVIAMCVAAALQGGPTVGHERTIEQVAARVASRWYTHGYAQALIEGQPIRRPVGVLRALIAPPECPAPRCEDGEDIDTHAVCPLCVERDADRAAERKPLRAI